MTPVRVPPLGLTKHARRDVLLLDSHFPDHPWALDGYVLRPLGGWEELREAAQSAIPRSVVLTRITGEDDVDRLRGLVRATPSVPVVAAMRFGAAGVDVVRGAVAAGAADVANLEGVTSLAALVPTLRRAHAQPLKRRVEASLPVWMGEDARTLLRAAVETVVDGGGRDVFAGIFGVYARTLSVRCAELRLPAPRRLLGWMRVLLALTLLEEEGRTVLNVAAGCGYNDGSSLKRAIENFTGATGPGFVRDARFGDAFDRFAEELRSLRHARPSAARR